MISNKRAPWTGVLLSCVFLFGTVAAQADTLARRQNLTDLIGYADVIIHGDVVSVTDGFENDIPYTEVTVKVKETLRGSVPETYTFRQFGLLKPRSMGNGLVNYNVTPVDWATYTPHEEVVLFLYKSASKTGLRTTVGLGQGKFTISGGRITSQQGNVGLFQAIDLDAGLLNKAEREMFATAKGPVNSAAFLTLVRRAVGEKWVETRKMSHAK